jgi:hypothetical protein
MKLVIAGNAEQYKGYIRACKDTLKTAKYCWREDQIRGYTSDDNLEIVRTGEFWKNPLDDSPYLLTLENNISYKRGIDQTLKQLQEGTDLHTSSLTSDGEAYSSKLEV